MTKNSYLVKHRAMFKFSGSGILGSISTELGNFTSLQTLDLSSNSLSGSIPSELGQL